MSETSSAPPQSKSAFKRFAPLAVIAAVAVAGIFFLGDYLNFETLRDNREALLAFRDENFLLLSVIFILGYAAIIAFALPGAAIASITGGFLFAMFPGTLFNMIAATLGATGTFMAARYGIGEAAEQKLAESKGVMGRIKKGIDENQWETLFLVRLLPIFPFFVANLALSVVGVPLWKYVVGTFFGILPGALVYTSIGAGRSDVFARVRRLTLASSSPGRSLARSSASTTLRKSKSLSFTFCNTYTRVSR